MGPKRYDIAGIRTFLRSKAYSGTIRFRGECRNLSTRQGFLTKTTLISQPIGKKGGKTTRSPIGQGPFGADDIRVYVKQALLLAMAMFQKLEVLTYYLSSNSQV
jgi:hypothetical protein